MARKARLFAVKNVISTIFESLNCVICMETRPDSRQGGIARVRITTSEFFLRNFARIKRTGSEGKKIEEQPR